MYQHKRDEAMHEAGHAVVAALLGFTVTEVSIDPPGEARGRILAEGPAFTGWDEGCSAPGELVQIALLYCAGAVAQRTENPWTILENRAVKDHQAMRIVGFSDDACTEIMYAALHILDREDVRPLHEALVERLLLEGTVGDPGVQPDPILADPATWAQMEETLLILSGG